MSFVAEKSKIHESNLKRWMKEEEGENKIKSKCGRKILFPEFENELLKYITEKREKHKPVTSRVIFVQTRSIKKKLKISDSQMKCTWGWFQKFLVRNKLSLRSPTSKIAHPLEDLQKEVKNFKEKIAEYFTSSKE